MTNDLRESRIRMASYAFFTNTHTSTWIEGIFQNSQVISHGVQVCERLFYYNLHKNFCPKKPKLVLPAQLPHASCVINGV